MNAFEQTGTWAKKLKIPCTMKDAMTSTNDVAKEEAFQTHDPLKLYLAQHQTEGRGRFDRTWEDEGHGGFLLSTWSFDVSRSPSPMVTPRIGLMLVESFSKIFPEGSWSLKAPNDILLNGKKVAGILTEVVSKGDQFRLIVGLGVNVSKSPKALKTATSLTEGLGEVSTDQWSLFLKELKNGLEHAARMSHMSKLEPSECSQILDWLNENPNLKEQYCEVNAEGQLVYDGQVLNWMEL
ncbi:MAG: biotin--[acetyl-CoA-carboxylase] ligase [Bdellovibrionaceae bacterium]|nr:biotin--[acetyl-CoA-carboxylase] ligase [Pseudobdellovibrionaceae bacterium]